MNRRHIFLLIFMAFICLAPVNNFSGMVRFVYDGDTIILTDGQKIRYMGIDAPEIGHDGNESEFMALSSLKLNRKLVSGKRVALEYDSQKTDKYGRSLAYVFLETGDMVNAILIRKGMAHVLLTSHGLKYKDLLLEYQRKAITEKIGIWSNQEITEHKIYSGNLNSCRFHRSDCPFGKQISRKNLVIFKSLKDAFWEGFSPCKHCKPQV